MLGLLYVYNGKTYTIHVNDLYCNKYNKPCSGQARGIAPPSFPISVPLSTQQTTNPFFYLLRSPLDPYNLSTSTPYFSNISDWVKNLHINLKFF